MDFEEVLTPFNTTMISKVLLKKVFLFQLQLKNCLVNFFLLLEMIKTPVAPEIAKLNLPVEKETRVPNVQYEPGKFEHDKYDAYLPEGRALVRTDC